MGVFQDFLIVKMVPNRATYHIFMLTEKTLIIDIEKEIKFH